MGDALAIIFLGSGGSEGIPCPNCNCPACSEAKLYVFERRRQTSVLITDFVSDIIVDAGFNILEELEFLSPDAILITHWHYDHIMGLFSLSWSRKHIPLYAPHDPLNDVFESFLREARSLDLAFLTPFKEVKIGKFKITPVPLEHTVPTLGYLIEHESGNIAILFDTKGLPKQTLNFLKRKHIDIALVDATYAPGVFKLDHNNVDEAVETGLKIRASRIVLTHITHNNLPYSKLSAYVRKWPNVEIALDGMVLNL